ncbi:MAG: hypothetical protein HZA93_27580 [Verrucomicrobia bacterium]|nr:hypothetical protein [Verrucomicrobiota bacterium]
MQNITELHRLASPFPKPQAICADGPTLWLSSRETKRFYAVERSTLKVTWEIPVPDGDTVWGVTRHGDALYVVCGVDLPNVDGRRIRRVRPGQGFDPAFVLPCPDGMGSHLSHDGASLVLSQWYPQKLISVGADGTPGRVLKSPHQVVGHCHVGGQFYLATTTDEESDEYFLEKLDPRTGGCVVLARIGFSARGLAFDGVSFWTNHRERNQIVGFARPRE